MTLHICSGYNKQNLKAEGLGTEGERTATKLSLTSYFKSFC